MDQHTLLIAFIAVTSAAVVLQTLILAGMYASSRKMGKRVEALSAKVEDQVLPLVEKVRGIVDEAAPSIRTVVANLTETSNLVRSQAGQFDEALTEIVTGARVQASRAGLVASRTLERVDMTAAVLQNTVLTPLRAVSALAEGLMAGFGEFMGGRKVRNSKAVPSDEMFI